MSRARMAISLAAAVAAASGLATSIEAQDPPSPYLTWDVIERRIDTLCRAHPERVTRSLLGKTAEGRDIPVLRISNRATREIVPETLILTGVHPREQQPAPSVLWLTEELVTRREDPRIRRILDSQVTWVVPMLNVDGKLFDLALPVDGKGADWRKNRRALPEGSVGVDLNRNFSIRWGGNRLFSESWKTSTDQPSGAIYEGPSPFSEPESRAVAKFIEERPLRSMIDVHSPLRAIYYPGYLIRPEWERFRRVAESMAAGQKAPYPVTKGFPDQEPKPGVRSGDTGLTYHWAYLTQGSYGFNLEIGLAGRYPPMPAIEAEYRANVREPLLRFLEATPGLPPREQGTVKLKSAGTDRPLSPGRECVWTPQLEGEWDFAALESLSPEVLVQSEIRLAPLKTGFSLSAPRNARSGSHAMGNLYVWDRHRRRTKLPVEWTLQEGATP